MPAGSRPLDGAKATKEIQPGNRAARRAPGVRTEQHAAPRLGVRLNPFLGKEGTRLTDGRSESVRRTLPTVNPDVIHRRTHAGGTVEGYERLVKRADCTNLIGALWSKLRYVYVRPR